MASSSIHKLFFGNVCLISKYLGFSQISFCCFRQSGCGQRNTLYDFIASKFKCEVTETCFMDVMWSLLENVSCILQKNAYSLSFGNVFACFKVRLVCSIVHVFHILSEFFVYSSISCWEKSIKISSYNCVYAWVLSDVQLFATLWGVCSPPVSSVHGIFQTRIQDWVPIFSTRGPSQPRDWTHISCIGRQILYHRTT